MDDFLLSCVQRSILEGYRPQQDLLLRFCTRLPLCKLYMYVCSGVCELSPLEETLAAARSLHWRWDGSGLLAGLSSYYEAALDGVRQRRVAQNGGQKRVRQCL